MPREKPATFEELYARLEQSVGKLEHGGLSLEEAIALYEEGMTLARQCQERLDDAEQKITKLKESFANIAPGTSTDGATGDGDYELLPEDVDIDDESSG
jgi:exodeoxyribonuclease VII small subunit